MKFQNAYNDPRRPIVGKLELGSSNKTQICRDDSHT